MLHIGIDEAGYGPMMGPLVLGGSAFRLAGVDLDRRMTPEFESDPLAEALNDIIVRPAKGSRRSEFEEPLPVPVDDSKVLFGKFGREGLSRAVGAFASATDRPPPADLFDVLNRFSLVPPDPFEILPWYQDLGHVSLPLYPWTGPLNDAFLAKGVEAIELNVLPVPVPAFNHSVSLLDNKASVLGMHCASVLMALLSHDPYEDAEVLIDRHGSRRNYEDYLEALFSDATISLLHKGKTESSYHVELPNRKVVIRFLTKGDGRSLAISWASVIAKLTRELFMQCINDFFQARVPGLLATAGYVEDGRRFMDDIGPWIDANDQDLRSPLVRRR